MNEYAVGSRVPPSALRRSTPEAPGWVALAAGFAALAAAVALAPAAAGDAGRALPASGLALRGGALAALAAAALAGAIALRGRLAALAPWWIALAVFGTATWAMALWQPLPVFALAAVASGFAVVLFERSAPRRRAAGPGEAAEPQMYEGDAAPVARQTVPRWLLAGALLAVPAVWHPAFLGLLLGPLGARPAHARHRALASLLGGALATLAVGLLATGALARWAGDLRPPALDGRLVGWNLAWALVGRHAGAFVYFPTLLLLLFADPRDRFARSLLLGFGVTLLALVVLRPFDWLLGPSLVAAPALLPLAGACWFLPVRGLGARGLMVLAALAGGTLFGLYRAPLAPPVDAAGAPRYVAPWLARLPVEVSQRLLPGVRDAQSGPLHLRLVDGATATDAVGALRIRAGARAELFVITANATPAFDLELASKAMPKLRVDGATLGDTAFRPDGRVGFELRPSGAPLEVPLWWSPSRQSVVHLVLELEGAGDGPVGFTLTPGTVRRSGR